MKKIFVLFSFFMMFLSISLFGKSPNNPPPADKWSDWHTKNPSEYIQIKWRDNGKYSYEIKVYKSERGWNALAKHTGWTEIDHFTISPDDPGHNKGKTNLYLNVDLDKYEVVANYAKGNVHTKGKITAPDGAHSWDTTLDSFSTDHIDVNKEGDYYFNSVSEFWKMRCSSLPCGPWVTFPGYGEAHGIIKGLTVNGKKQDVVVQLWKGFCPRFLDVNKKENKDMKDLGSQFPGGVGAEVGLYTNLAKDGLSWYPLVTDDIKIAFKLVNRKTGEVVVEAKEKATWWHTKWMTTGSYDKYKQTHDCPPDPMDYDLQVWFNGMPLSGEASTWNWSDGTDGQVKVKK